MSAALKAGPAVPGWLAGTLIGIALGGVGGYYAKEWSFRPPGERPNMPGMAGGMGGAPGGGMMGGGGGGAQDHPNAAALIRNVGALATLESARGRELTADQRGQVKTLAAALKSDAALSEEQCDARLKELKALLTDEQNALLETMTARPGGGRGGPGGGPGASGMMGALPAPGSAPGAGAGNRPAGNGPGGGGMMGGGGPMGGGMMGGGMMGGGAQTDYEHPFKEGRGRDRLEELLTSLDR